MESEILWIICVLSVRTRCDNPYSIRADCPNLSAISVKSMDFPWDNPWNNKNTLFANDEFTSFKWAEMKQFHCNLGQNRAFL